MQNFDEIKEKYGLPEFDKIDFEFEIGSLDEDEFILRNIRKKIAEKLDFYAKILEEQLQPEAQLPVIHECRFIEDEDKMILFDIYKKLMNLIRKSSRLSILNKEEEDAQYIKESLIEWEQMKKPLLKLFKNFEDSWSKEVPVEEAQRYLG